MIKPLVYQDAAHNLTGTLEDSGQAHAIAATT